MNKKPLTINWVTSIPFFLFHLAAIGVFFVDFSWTWVFIAIGYYFLRMFGITAGYHRYFSHRTYKMNRVAQFIMALIGTLSVQKGVLWWAANHRIHHRFSDTEQDIHSPSQTGFWWSHVGWILSDKWTETRWEQIPDLKKYPELVFLNQFSIAICAISGILIATLLGWSAFFWVFIVSTIFLWHGTFTINSLSHVFGSRRYVTSDTSRNNPILAFITMGEGWHNNHHCYQSSTNQGFYWWEWDPSYYILKGLSYIGVTKDLRKPPLKLLEAKRIKSSSNSVSTPIHPLTRPSTF